uniref:TOX high mobility group box family member 4 b n=1 Tax=Xiphophorus couchianus TaxID=32473 RepID=A0A3B5LE84_9TELE
MVFPGGSENYLSIPGSGHPFLSSAETFHTPSLGDEEFEIPPISLDPDSALTVSDVVSHFGELSDDVLILFFAQFSSLTWTNPPPHKTLTLRVAFPFLEVPKSSVSLYHCCNLLVSRGYFSVYVGVFAACVDGNVL